MEAVRFPIISGLKSVTRSAPVVLAYLFGSTARGSADADSDIDIAVVADASLTRAERQALRVRLACSFAKALALPIDRFDVVLLQDVPTLLQFNVISQGVVIHESSPSARREYEVDVKRRYDRDRSRRDRETEETIGRILSRLA